MTIEPGALRTEDAMAVEVDAGRGRKSQMTRQRLLDSANRLFRANGYAATTAAAIAEDAGVTERTFYRYFPAKADVLLTNWQRRRDVLHRVLVTSDAPEMIDVVHAAMHEFAEHVRIGIDAGLDSMPHVFADRDASSAVLQVLLAVEHDLATEIARRAGGSSEDFEVRTAAYATVGVFRASLRAVGAHGDTAYITALVDEGMDRLRPLYSGFDQTSSPSG
jgi:TetR/AcrR family transcriptional regulator, regulator of mycofactocin system